MIHYSCSPSSLHRRAACPGSMCAESELPDTAGEEAARGTRLHSTITKMILLLPGALIEAETEDADEIEALQFCLDYHARRRAEAPTASIILEEYLDLSWIHELIGGGTADAIHVLPYESALVVDWKFGRGDVPAAAGNLQLMAYACAVARRFDVPKVQVDLVQAATRRITSHTYSAADLDAVAVELRRIAAACNWMSIRNAGSHCKYCKALAMCPAAKEAVEGAMKRDATHGLALAELMPLSELATTWAGEIKRRTHETLTAGGVVPGYGLVEGRGSRIWIDGAAERIQAAAAAMGKPVGDCYEPQELRSPSGLEKVWGKAKEIREILEPLIKKKTGAPRVEKV